MGIFNKIRKTNQQERGTYTYEYSTAEGGIEKVTIVPNRDGVTEIDIKRLHALDDSEVYFNLKNLRPSRNSVEKEEIKIWRESYIKNFKRENGYLPSHEDVKFAEEEVFPRQYNLSLDDDTCEVDKTGIAHQISYIQEDIDEWSDRMLLAFEQLTDKQREVIDLMFVKGFKQHEVAAILGISPAAVHTHLSKAKKIIKKFY